MDKRIAAVKTASVGLVVVVILAVQVFTAHVRLEQLFDDISVKTMARVLMTEQIGQGAHIDENLDWIQAISMERIKRADADPPSDVEYATGIVADHLGNMPFADQFDLTGAARLPDGKLFRFARLHDERERGRVIKLWRELPNASRSPIGDAEAYEVFKVWREGEQDKAAFVLFGRNHHHGDSIVPVNEDGFGNELHAAPVTGAGDAYRLADLASDVRISAQEFGIAPAEADEAYRQAHVKLRNERVKVPVLNLDVAYLPAVFFLLGVTIAYAFSISASLRQLVTAPQFTATEPWLVIEPLQNGTTIDRSVHWLARSISIAIFVSSVVSTVAIAIIAYYAARPRQPWVGISIAAAVVLAFLAVDTAISIVRLVRRVRTSYEARSEPAGTDTGSAQPTVAVN